MFINTIQFISRYLKFGTIVKLYHITNFPFLNNKLKQQLGYSMLSLNDLINNNLYICIGNKLQVYSQDENTLVIFHKKNKICFEILLYNEILTLLTNSIEIYDIKSFNIMIKTFIKSFTEFHIEKALIQNKKNVQVILKFKDGNLVIPEYINKVSVFDGRNYVTLPSSHLANSKCIL